MNFQFDAQNDRFDPIRNQPFERLTGNSRQTYSPSNNPQKMTTMKTTQSMNLLPILNSRKSCRLANIFAIAMLILTGVAMQADAQSVWNAVPGSSADIN